MWTTCRVSPARSWSRRRRSRRRWANCPTTRFRSTPTRSPTCTSRSSASCRATCGCKSWGRPQAKSTTRSTSLPSRPSPPPTSTAEATSRAPATPKTHHSSARTRTLNSNILRSSSCPSNKVKRLTRQPIRNRGSWPCNIMFSPPRAANLNWVNSAPKANRANKATRESSPYRPAIRNRNISPLMATASLILRIQFLRLVDILPPSLSWNK